ncbi:MAG TPA: L-rhamnose isomerase, partial [Anaeromyxobacteraceae bacterium]|nr:L-rhamnose isomerase [Anaeromyxobacteraceae bacterium]
MTRPSIAGAYALACQAYADVGVDAEAALARLDRIPISLNCWQGDDVRGFEDPQAPVTGGIAATGSHPGRARNGDELRGDADVAMAQIPGPKRFNLHAIYLEADRPVPRDEIRPEHFQRWVDWARARGIGLDFNPSCFSHPLSEQGMTLSHPDPAVRRFWIDHCRASRAVSAHFGRSLGTPSIMDIWVPDGSKDLPFDRFGPRQRLLESLDEILAEPIPRELHRDAVEGKLFGLGAESYTVGSNDFYLAYAVRRGIMLCLDTGHFHPTEVVSDKLSAALPFLDGILLHLSRGVRWDSDHVVLLDDETQAIAHELVRGGVLDRVAVAVDFFDASINRVAAWVIGTRNVRRALLRALLEPAGRLEDAERRLDPTARLALLEEQKSLPWSAVWAHYCESRGAPPDVGWLDAVRAHERRVAAERGAPLPAAPPSPGPSPAPIAARASEAEDVFRSPAVEAQKARILDMGRRLWQRAYVDGNGGNISVRVTDDLVLCTPTLVSKGFMTAEDLCLVDMEGVQRAGSKKATSEILMHLAIYKAQPLARACVHAHPPHATGFAVSYVQPVSCLVPEMEIFCGEIPIAPYFTPGTPPVGESVARLCDRHTTVLMGNHGAVAWGFDVQDAYFKMEIL